MHMESDSVEIYHPGEQPPYTMALVYGDPGAGKSRFMTSLPESLGDIILVTSDSKSEALKSVLPKYRERITVFNPKVKTGSGSKIDPVAAAFTIAKADLKQQFPKMGVLVWDTITTTGKSMLQHNADLGKYTKNPIRYEIGGEMLTQPSEGDFGATQGQLDRLMDILGEQPFHVIIGAHAAIAKTKEGTIIGGGPATVGQATITTFAGRFDPAVYLQRKVIGAVGSKPGKVEYFAHTEPMGIWNAKIRENNEGDNPLAHVLLEHDPVHFWDNYFTNY